ncbi:TetR/AcrR family transcriptional regulator [Lacimicrobium alkaliphilum]|uniref:TetR family transcriptional regulator n=1 Tax=Lacimicrobium alkaliphilum TaxID=1526571 RepID=A0ABQ1QWH4_9ALTE|nr:TetR/AcrR family transcriptional regulator [Lacimicrobium alkaliphilum]GGD48548.1 TetR family transcriptional regulator [Lacimicrobium alkaliphilum]
MTDKNIILDKALQLGKQTGWENLSLADTARVLDIPLVDIYQHFSQKDELVDAWFDRADRHLLSIRSGPQWLAKPPAQRIEEAVWRWLEALAEYRHLTGQMLLYKLEPGHIHLQIGGLLRISRTVQWLMEVANLRARHLARIQQEIALTTVFVSTFVHWLNDNSEQQHCSRRSLSFKLRTGALLKIWK